MEKSKCKFCSRVFANGRALGGHMRTHNLIPGSFVEESQEETNSACLLSYSEEEKESMCYGLRENPKKSIKLADPEFTFVKPVPVQDRESKSESSKNPVPRRSNRFRKAEYPLRNEPESKRANHGWVAKPNLVIREPEPNLVIREPEPNLVIREPEPVSPENSDTTTEENLAFCLIMMKRDKWTHEVAQVSEEEEEEDDEVVAIEEDYLSDESMKQRKVKSKYKCETCNKVLKSYQALGGHRASHKRARVVNHNLAVVYKADNNEEKSHVCPVCLRVFSSGQALGGHKRTHVMGSSSMFVAPSQETRFEERVMIDLNLPAPEVDEDGYSPIEHSTVSEADFGMNSTRH